MVIAATLSADLGLVPAAWADRIVRLVQRAGLPVQAPDLGADRWFELMAVDKKAEAGDIRYVLLDGLGHATLRAVPRAAVQSALDRHTVVPRTGAALPA